MAEAIDGGVVRTLQKFIAQNAWDDEVVPQKLRRRVAEILGADDAVLIVR